MFSPVEILNNYFDNVHLKNNRFNIGYSSIRQILLQFAKKLQSIIARTGIALKILRKKNNFTVGLFLPE